MNSASDPEASSSKTSGIPVFTTHDRSSREPHTSRVGGAATGIGLLLGLFARDLGRAFAVGGALYGGYVGCSLAHQQSSSHDAWKLLAIGSATFVLTAWVCSRD